MRAKAHAFVADFAKIRKTEYLEAAGIRKNRARPGHEFVQAAEFAHDFMAGAKIQMVSVGENDFGAELFQRLVAQRLYGGLRAYRHEERRLYGTVGSGQHTTPRTGRVGLRYLKRKTHPASVSGEDERPPHADHDERGPHAKSNDVRFRTLELFGRGGCKTDGEQNQNPEREHVKRFAKRDEPLRGVIRKDRCDVCSEEVLQIDRAGVFQIQDEQKYRATYDAGHERVGGDRQSGRKVRIRTAEQRVRTPHDQSNDNDHKNWAANANGIREVRRKLCARLDLLVLLRLAELSGPRVLLDLLAHELPPIHSLVYADAYDDAERRRDQNGQQPAWLPDNVLEGLLRREKDPKSASECAYLRLGLRCIGRYRGCR